MLGCHLVNHLPAVHGGRHFGRHCGLSSGSRSATNGLRELHSYPQQVLGGDSATSCVLGLNVLGGLGVWGRLAFVNLNDTHDLLNWEEPKIMTEKRDFHFIQLGSENLPHQHLLFQSVVPPVLQTLVTLAVGVLLCARFLWEVPFAITNNLGNVNHSARSPNNSKEHLTFLI